MEDVLGDDSTHRARSLQTALTMIAEKGRGVAVLIRERHPTRLSDFIRARKGEIPPNANELRDYGVGAQILLDLGVRDMILLSNTKRTIVGLDGYGLRVVGQRPIDALGKA
jgi:3,4-dihydroxy 2-butanone 4-phosphate synthase/GTP cyclohydrolase II